MKEASWLWEQLHDQFETDDGSLPDVYIEYIRHEAVAEAYLIVCRRAASTVTRDPYFWSKTENREVPLHAAPNPAALVIAYEAEPFHVVFGGIQAKGTRIPDLGVFVFQECVALDYRMGSEWGPQQLDAFFHLLAELSDLDSASKVGLDKLVDAETQNRFRESFDRYRREMND